MRRNALVLACLSTACLCAPLSAAPAFAQEPPPAAEAERAPPIPTDDPELAALPAETRADGDYDPWENTNRRFFSVHESIDRALLDPSARGYREVTPSPVRSGVSNFLRNLRGPQIFANDVLQGQLGRAGVTAARFGVNSTIGLLGIFDPATDMGLERHTEDFGQTLAVWGVPAGPYMFIPALGPSNVRDSVGAVLNMALDPFFWVEFDYDTEFMIARTGMTALAARESVIEAVDNVRESSIDPYVTIRSTYGLLRESAIRNGLQDVQDLPDFEDIPSEADGVEDAPAEPDALQSVTPDTEAGSAGVHNDIALLVTEDLH